MAEPDLRARALGAYLGFAVGDARSGNVKRVASAVGEGSISIQMVFKALQDL